MKYILLFILLAYICPVFAGEIKIPVKDGNLYGTLEIPDTIAKIPVVLIIAGSGPTDRDGNSAILPGKNNSLKQLAEKLYSRGIASLRFDKRGVGESAKEFKIKEDDLTFETFIDDAVKAIEFLQNDKMFSKIIVLGHSEGSLIGMAAALRTNADAFISVEGTGRPAYELIAEQLDANTNKEDFKRYYNGVLDSLKSGFKVKNVNPILFSFFRPSVQPYLISWFKYDPAKEISKIKKPVLIIQGTTDIQVKEKDAEILAKSNKNSKLKIIENMNHVLKSISTLDKTAQIKTYSDPTLEISQTLINSIVNFIQ